MTVKPHTLQQSLTPSTFECQLPSVQIDKDQPIAFANIYRPHDINRPEFYGEFSELLTSFGNFIDHGRFIACGDFNCSDAPTVISAQLQFILDIHGLQQHVRTATRHTPDSSSLLDLVSAALTHLI